MADTSHSTLVSTFLKLARREALTATESTLLAIIDAIPQLVLVKGAYSKILWANRAFSDFYGMTREELIDIHDAPFNEPDFTLAYIRDDNYVFTTGSTLEIPEEPVTRHDGKICYLHTVKSAIRDEVGIVVMTLGISKDISELREANRKLSQAQNRAKKIIDTALDAVLIVNSEGRITDCNPKAQELFGWRLEEVLGAPWADTIIAPDFLSPVNELFSRFLDEGNTSSGGERIEISALRRDGCHFPTEITVVPVQGDDGIEFSCFIRDITERKEYEDSITAAREAAESASRAKTQFLANMSHEIRTPMNGLLGMIRFLNETNLDVEQRELIATARDCADSLLTVLNDILDFSKIEAERLELRIAAFSVENEVRRAVSFLFRRAEEKGVTVWWSIDPAIPTELYGDPDRLRQIFINLISNSVKFTAPGGVVLLWAEKSARDVEDEVTVTFNVLDNGIGIDDEEQRHIFKPFVQASEGSTRNYGGTGLGLSICKRLIELMGGDLILRSRKNVGTLLRFPVAFKLQDPNSIDVNRELDRVADRRPRGIEIPSLKILVAEDNSVNQKVAQHLLEKLGHRVSLASNGQEAVNHWERERFDLILMDIQMPGVDGIEATKRIRSRESAEGSRTPIIALTAHAMSDDRQKCLEYGMDEYLSKPINRSELQFILESLWNEKESLRNRT